VFGGFNWSRGHHRPRAALGGKGDSAAAAVLSAELARHR